MCSSTRGWCVWWQKDDIQTHVHQLNCCASLLSHEIDQPEWKFAAFSCRTILAFAFKPHCVAQPSEHSTTSEDTELISEFSVIVERLLIEIYWIEKSGSFQKSMLWHRSNKCSNVDCVVWQGNRIISHILFKRPFFGCRWIDLALRPRRENHVNYVAHW